MTEQQWLDRLAKDRDEKYNQAVHTVFVQSRGVAELLEAWPGGVLDQSTLQELQWIPPPK